MEFTRYKFILLGSELQISYFAPFYLHSAAPSLMFLLFSQYMNALTYLTSEAFSNIPPDLVSDLQRMLSMDAMSRPSAMAFTGVYHLLFPHLREYQ